MIVGEDNDAREIASHAVPSILGATDFPFVDADVVLHAYGATGATVFSEEYLPEHARFVAILLRTGMENHRSLGHPYRKDRPWGWRDKRALSRLPTFGH